MHHDDLDLDTVTGGKWQDHYNNLKRHAKQAVNAVKNGDPMGYAYHSGEAAMVPLDAMDEAMRQL